jgi:hypothetical protein
MQCDEFLRQIDEVFDRRGVLDAAELMSHALVCEECHAALEKARLLQESIDQWRMCEPEIDLADQIVQRYSACQGQRRLEPLPSSPRAVWAASAAASPSAVTAREGHSRQRNERRSWQFVTKFVGGLTVASVMAAMAGMYSGSFSGSFFRENRPELPAGDNQALRSSVPQKSAAQRSLAGNSSRRVAEESTVPVRGYSLFGRDMSVAFRGVRRFVTPDAPAEAPAREAEPDSKPGAESGWVEDLHERIAPIGRRLDETFDFLWQAGESVDDSHT